MSKELDYYMLHCLATEAGKPFFGKDVLYWHTAPKPIGRGWKRGGYSDLILLDGEVENLYPYNDNHIVEEWEITNGAFGYNSRTRHLAYVGGLLNGKPHDTRTKDQKYAMYIKINEALIAKPDLIILGHNQISGKNCPAFDVPAQLREWGIPEKNIFND